MFPYILFQLSIGSFTINRERRINVILRRLRVPRHRWGNCTVREFSRIWETQGEELSRNHELCIRPCIIRISTVSLDTTPPGASLYLYKESLYRVNTLLMFSTTSVSIYRLTSMEPLDRQPSLHFK